MRLTNFIREAYINSVMNDLPSIDYQQQIIKFVTKTVMDSLPESVKKVWKDPATNKFINMQGNTYGGVYVCLPCLTSEYPKLGEKCSAELAVIVIAKKAQAAAFDVLRNKVKQAAYGCTTRKSLVELLPEFEKYLPPETEGPNRQLPVIANLMVELVKAGWPKGGRDKPSIKPAAVAA